MWNLKCTIIPVIIGATGVVTGSLRKNLEAVPGKHSIERWGSPLVQETYQEEKTCDKRHQ
jgi:hypothetical protein